MNKDIIKIGLIEKLKECFEFKDCDNNDELYELRPIVAIIDFVRLGPKTVCNDLFNIVEKELKNRGAAYVCNVEIYPHSAGGIVGTIFSIQYTKQSNKLQGENNEAR